MNQRIKFGLFILGIIISSGVYSQVDSLTLSKINLKYEILDTLNMGVNAVTLNVLWIDDTVRIRFKQDLHEENIVPTWNIYQNCYSYALEKYFENSQAYCQSLFNSTTFLEEVDKILNSNFSEKFRLESKLDKKLYSSIPNDVLIAFLDKYANVVHLIYYNDGVFYSKNGGLQPIEFKSLNKYMTRYYLETEQLIIYQINEKKVRDTYANKI